MNLHRACTFGGMARGNFSRKGSRRSLLRNSFLLSCAAFAGPFLNAQTSVAPGLETRRLNARTLLISGPDSNALAVDSEQGIILVDGGHASWTESLQQHLRDAFPGQPVRALFNTHWHPEQTGSNRFCAEQGAEIIAHENTRLWLSTEVRQRWSGEIFAPLDAAALPTRSLLNSEALDIAEHSLHAQYLWNAHTDGDIAVYFREENILCCGGLVANGLWSLPDWWTGGYTGGMLDSFNVLLSLADEQTTIIPAYGASMTLDELKAQNSMYVTVIDRIQELFIQSRSLAEILAARPAAEFEAQMGDATLFISLAFQSLVMHLRDPQNFRLLNIP